MATDNRGVMVYLNPELERELQQYCIDNNITRKNKDGDILPSLGTGIVQYLKSTILSMSPRTAPSLSPGTVSHSHTSLLPSNVPSDRLTTGITKAEILELIAKSKTSNTPNTVLTREDVVSIARGEIEQALEPIEAEIENLKMVLSRVPTSSPLALVPSPDKFESTIVATNSDPTNWELSPIANLLSTGMSCRSIADELNLLGFTNTKGGAATRQSVESYVSRRPNLKAIYDDARKKGD